MGYVDTDFFELDAGEFLEVDLVVVDDLGAVGRIDEVLDGRCATEKFGEGFLKEEVGEQEGESGLECGVETAFCVTVGEEAVVIIVDPGLLLIMEFGEEGFGGDGTEDGTAEGGVLGNVLEGGHGVKAADGELDVLLIGQGLMKGLGVEGLEDAGGAEKEEGVFVCSLDALTLLRPEGLVVGDGGGVAEAAPEDFEGDECHEGEEQCATPEATVGCPGESFVCGCGLWRHGAVPDLELKVDEGAWVAGHGSDCDEHGSKKGGA
mgnify:CR=1 FL=1